MTNIDAIRNAEIDQTKLNQINTGLQQQSKQTKTDEKSADNKQFTQKSENEFGENSVSKKTLPDAISGKDVSQILALDKLNEIGGFSATEILLGLDQSPTFCGILPPPMVNEDAFKYLSPATRRSILNKLINKQQKKVKRMAIYVRRLKDEEDDRESAQRNRPLVELSEENQSETSPPKLDQAMNELTVVASMLDTLNELLKMQDYAISQVGTFSQG